LLIQNLLFLVVIVFNGFVVFINCNVPISNKYIWYSELKYKRNIGHNNKKSVLLIHNLLFLVVIVFQVLSSRF